MRRAEPGDEPAVAGVHVRAWQVAYRGLLPDQYLEGLRPEDRAARYTFGDTGPGRASTLVAVARDSICGFATFGACRDTDQQAGEVHAIYVDPDWWGCGAGRSLMSEARHCLLSQDFDIAFLWVLVGNERAERFYRADGWLPDGSRRTEHLHGVTLDEIRYRTTLPWPAGR